MGWLRPHKFRSRRCLRKPSPSKPSLGNRHNSKLRSRKSPQQKETMASTDDKPTLKITLEDLASVEMPAAAPAGNMRLLQPEPNSMATSRPLLMVLHW